MAEVENLTARRALQTNNNRGLDFDTLCDIVKDDPDSARATKYLIVALEEFSPEEGGGIKNLNYYMANMSRTEVVAATAIVQHRALAG